MKKVWMLWIALMFYHPGDIADFLDKSSDDMAQSAKVSVVYNLGGNSYLVFVDPNGMDDLELIAHWEDEGKLRTYKGGGDEKGK